MKIEKLYKTLKKEYNKYTYEQIEKLYKEYNIEHFNITNNKEEYSYHYCQNTKCFIKWFKYLIKRGDRRNLKKLFLLWEEYIETQNKDIKEIKIFGEYYTKYKDFINKEEEKILNYKKKVDKELFIYKIKFLLDKKDYHEALSHFLYGLKRFLGDKDIYIYGDKITQLAQDDFIQKMLNKLSGIKIDLKDIKEKKDIEDKIKLFKKQKTKESYINGLILLLNFKKNNKKKQLVDEKFIEKNKKYFTNKIIELIKKEEQREFDTNFSTLKRVFNERRFDKVFTMLETLLTGFHFVNKRKLYKLVEKIMRTYQEKEIEEKVGKLSIIDKINFKFTKVTEKDLLVFYQKMARFLRGGINMGDILKILNNSIKKNEVGQRKIVYTLRKGINQGKNITDSLKEIEEIPERDLNIIAIAEEVGKLKEAFINLTELYENTIQRKKKIKSLMIYPSIILIIAFIGIVVMLGIVFPKFIIMFQQLNVELPAVTKFVIHMSEFLQKHYIYLIGGIIGLIVFLKFFLKTETGYVFKSYLLLHLPVIKELHRRNEFINFLNNFYILYSNGINIEKTLDYLIKGATNYFFKEELKNIRLLVVTGDNISTAFGYNKDEIINHSKYLPDDFIFLIHVGEMTGEISSILKDYLKIEKEDYEMFVGKFQQLIEPMLIMFVASIIAILVISIILPIATMYKSIGSFIK